MSRGHISGRKNARLESGRCPEVCARARSVFAAQSQTRLRYELPYPGLSGSKNVQQTVLVGPDGGSHVYEPTPQDAVALAEADVVFENGLEFETWLDDLYTASGSIAVRIVVSDGIEPLAFEEHDHEHEGEDHGGFMEDEPLAGTRLIVNDYERGTVHVIAMRTNEVIAEFELTARQALYPSPRGRYAVAIHAAGNITNLIDSVVSTVSHEDHFHASFSSLALPRRLCF